MKLAIVLTTEALGKQPVSFAPTVSSSSPSSSPPPSSSELHTRVKISRNTLDYLYRLLHVPPDSEQCDPAQARDELRGIFTSVRSISSSLTQPESRVPLTLLCAGAANVLPWELLFDEPVVRAPTLASFIGHDRPLDPLGPPLYLVPYYSEAGALSGDKGLQVFEQRKEWLALSARTDLHLALPLPSGSRSLANELQQTPLVKWGKKQPKEDKKTMPFLSYVDVSAIEHFTDLGYVLEAQSGSQPVFVASLADLVCPTEALQFLLVSQCTVIFVPEVRLRAVLTKLTGHQERLLKNNSRALKTNKELASLLLSSAASASSEEHVPVIVVNLPR